MKFKIVLGLMALGVLATLRVEAATYELWVAGRFSSATLGNGGIARYSAKDGSFLGYFMHTNSGSGLVTTPGAGTVSKAVADGTRIYVGYLASNNFNKVFRYDRNGGDPSPDFITGPGGSWRFGSYYYPIKGLLFKADYLYLMAGVYTNNTPDMPAGTYLFRHTLDGAIAGTQPNTPLGYSRGAQFSGPTNLAPISSGTDLVQDSAGNVYALISSNIYRFASDGGSYGPGGPGDTNAFISGSALSLSVVNALAVDNTGRIYVSGDQGSVTTGYLLRFNSNGTPAGTNGVDAIFTKYVTYLKGVVRPQTMAISPVDGCLYVGNGYVGGSPIRYENMINRFYIGGANDGKLIEAGGFANLGGTNAPLYLPSYNILFVKTSSSGALLIVK